MLIMYNCITWLHPDIYALCPSDHSYGAFSILAAVVVDFPHALYVPYSLLGAEMVGKELPSITMLGTCLRMKPRVRCSGRGTPCIARGSFIKVVSSLAGILVVIER